MANQSSKSGEVEVAISQPKLPAISESKNLVSQPLVTTHAELSNGKDRENVIVPRPGSSGELENDDVKLLLQQVSQRFVNALQQNTKQSWHHLCDVLDIIKPYAEFLTGAPEIAHYVERACQKFKDSEDDDCELTFVQEKISSVFPAEFSLAQEGTRPLNVPFPPGSSVDSIFTPRCRRAPLSKGVRIPRAEPVFPGGKTYVFDKSDGDMTSYEPKPLCLDDLKRSLPGVVREISFMEATHGASLGMMFLALDTDLPQTRVPTPPSIPRRSPNLPIYKPPSEVDNMSQHSETKKANLPKTGREVVESFVRGRFLGEVKFAFLNVAPSARYDPYNLVVVPEDKVNPEHYVISSHCVLHVSPHGPSESQPLAEWYREACLFKAISGIGFFKNFLTTKMFQKWKDIKKLSHFLKIEAEIERSLISNVPSFGSALLRISSLLQDLEKLTFLPFQITFSYTLEEFEESIFRTFDTGYHYMEKFFNYCQMIVDKTQESCFEYLEYCEGQVKNHRHNYHESLAVGKRKRAVRQHNLKLARDEVKRLGTFVRLVDHIIVSNLLTLVQGNISKFVNETMSGPHPERDGLFTADIVFGDDHKLVLLPSIKQFTRAVDVAVRSVISASCNLSHAMELGREVEAFQEKAENDPGEGKDDSDDEDDAEMLNGLTVQNSPTKSGKIGGDIEKLIYGMSKDSQIMLTGQQPVSHAKIAGMTHHPKEPDTSHTPISITRTDDEIYDDLDGLNSDLVRARDMPKETTQELCFYQDHNGGLRVEGQRFQDFAIDRSPLTNDKLMHIMHTNNQIKEGLRRQAHLLSEAGKEVNQFCDEHSWVAEIHEFVTSWGDGNVDTWRGQPTVKIEQQLNQIKAWNEKVLSMTKNFFTANGIFFVDCHEVQMKLLPQLNSIFKQMIQMVGLDIERLSDKVIKDVDNLSKLLTDHKTDIQGFASFMQKLMTVKEHVPNLKEEVEYIKNLYEVIRSCYRQLTPEEEVTEEKVWATWEGFLFSLQEASDFVDVHKTPVTEKLQDTISMLENNAEHISTTATSGEFLDPNENPTFILQDIKELREEFVNIRTKLSDLSKCQAIIVGEEYDLKHVTDILHAIDKRQELWRYCDASSHSIREWFQTAFKKMNVKKALDKLAEWNNAGEKLKQHIPVDDEVLQSWLTQLEEFSQDLPFLLQLSSDALKPRHWRALFIGMGQYYDPSWDFTVADLLSFNLGRYKDLITAICAGAAAEYALERQLNQLARAWLEKEFKLAKHIPLMRPRMEGDQRKSAKGKRKTKQTGHGAEKRSAKVKPKIPTSAPDMFILIGVGELKCIIEDHLVTLHMMLTSPHVVDLKPIVEMWITNLQAIENITDIWADCQKKWLYLSNVFAEPEIVKSLGDSNQTFLDVYEKYREFILVILKDPKVLSVLPLKKRGEKGWRELQGDPLRELLLELIRKEEELIRMVEEYVEKTRVAFPRLFFLSDNDLLSLLAWSRNPKDLLPFVRKCFPGIKKLRFALPKDSNVKLVTSLDTALNAHLLQVTALEGVLEEVIPLISVIPASPRPQGWLVTLEENMRNTLVQSLAECVQRRLNEKESPSKLLELITASDPQSQDHIMLKFPSQCVVTAEAVMWNRNMTEVLQNGSLRGLADLRKSLGGFVDDLSWAIRKNMEHKGTSRVNDRLELLLAALVAMAINQRDTVTEFVNNGITDVGSFEWTSQLQHQMEMKNIISSSYQGEDKFSPNSPTIPINHLYEIGLCSIRQLGTNFVYGYEYLGPIPRLIVTPLTQRCFLTLTMALRSHQCGVPVGPDGIGKTETIKDLSKAFGQHLVMFNCSEQLTNSMLVRFMYGMVRSGSWACFEHVDCLGAGILSCFAEHLSTIITSLRCLKKFVFSHYTGKISSQTGKQKNATIKRRNSVTSLISSSREAFASSFMLDPEWDRQLAKRKRHHSVSEGSDFQEADYYTDVNLQTSRPLEDQSKLPETFQAKSTREHKKKLGFKEFEMPFLGNIELEGQLMPASAMYGCFMTMSGSYCLNADMPENFRAQLRPVSMLFPDCCPVVEVWLVCCGFTVAKPLAMKINTFFKLISEQVSCQPQYSFGLRSMKMVTILAGKQLQRDIAKKKPSAMSSVAEESPSDLDGDAAMETKTRSPFFETLERRQSEENAVVHSLFTYFGNKLLLEDKEIFSNAVDEVFAHSVLMSVSTEGDPQLVDEVKEHLQANGLQVRQEVVSKILQLHTSLQTSHNVILLGCPGSGKSTIYTTLASALNSMHGRSTRPYVKARRPTASEKRKISISLRPAKVLTENIKEDLWPRVDLSTVFPKSLTCEELFGRKHPENNVWVDGVVSKWMRDSTLTCDTMAELLTSQSSETQRIARMMGSLSRVKKWLVLDGPMDDTWLENMGTLLDSTRALNLANGETITQPETVTLLFEVTELSHVSPALVTRCGLIHCSETTVGWKSIFRSWMKGAHAKWDITNRGLGIISCLIDHTVDSTLRFLNENCQSILTEGYGSTNKPSKTATGVYEVQTLLRYLSAIFDRHILREDEDNAIEMINQKQRLSLSSVSSRHSSGISASDTGRVISSFAFAFVWAFGGHLHERYAGTFDDHARQLLSSGPYPVLVPPEGSVYDYCLDFSKGGLVKWEERPGAQFKTLPSSYTVVSELDRYFYLVDLMVSTSQPVLLVGSSGVGKSSLVQNLINPHCTSTRMCLSPGLTSKLLQEAIEHKLQQIRRKEMSQMAIKKSLGGATAVKNLPVAKTRTQLLFLDDLNCAGADAFGSQPPLELLRQILSKGTLYNKERYHVTRVQHLRFMAACVPPGAATSCGGVASYPISHRLSRLMTVLSFFALSSESLRSIYRAVFLAWLEEFPAYSLTHHEQLAKALSAATVKMYNVIQQELRPTPLHPHFLFTQHELCRVVQGMTLLSSKSRGRPRPRARRRTVVGKETEQDVKGRALPAATSDHIFRGKENAQRGGHVGKGKSWPSLVSGPKETAISAKTPAVLSPMIRSLLRLWCHESTRTYSDRLLTEEHRHWFSSLLHETVEQFFCKVSSELNSEVFSTEKAVMQKNMQEIIPGTNAPPPTASDEQSISTEQDDNEVFIRADDSMALLSDEQRETSDESESDVDVVQDTVEEPLPEEGNTVAEGLEGMEIRPEGDQQSVCEDDADTLESQDDQSLIREDTSIENTMLTKPSRVKVTFEDTSGAGYDKSYIGPLISLEQLAFSGEDLTDVMFCKHFNASITGQESCASEVAGKNYLECAESILEQGIKRCLASYNDQVVQSSNARIMNLVTFRGALQHAARLSRALATAGGHALLLSSLGYGRRTLTRVTAHAACYKLIEVQRSQFQSQEELRQQIKVASFIAGLQGKPVVLFVPEGVDDDSMQDICSLMAEGTCPGLYTPNELSIISNQLLPGGKHGPRRMENQDIAQERYFRRIKSHLHVVVCLKYTPLNLSTSPQKNQLYRFPVLVTRSCCVDVYRAWPHKALVNVARKLLEDEENVLDLLPLKRRERASQTAAVCSIMAHVHLSSKSMVERIYGVKASKLYSPDTYLDFVDLFRKICKRLCTTEKEKVIHLEKAIKRIDEATNSLNKMQRELDQLAPLFEASKTDVQLRHEAVEACQREYAAAKEKCKKQEQDIEFMQGPIEKLKKEAQTEFEKVSPLFDVAWKAIESLDIYDLEEIRSYRAPPRLVTLVVNAVCLLFEKEQTWDEGKLLLNRKNFFKDLEFYDMKNMPDSIFSGLKVFYDNPEFHADVVEVASMAARSLCLWLRAVYEFCLVYRALEPKRELLAEAERELEKAKSIMGEMRVRCNANKQELELSIQLYKDSVKHSRTVEKQIQNIEAIKAKGTALVDSLSTYSDFWQSRRSSAKQRLGTAAGDALVTAAAVCYLGPLVPAAREELFSNWLQVCDGTSQKPKKRRLSLSSMILDDTRNNASVDHGYIGRESRPESQLTLAPTMATTTLSLRKDVSLQTILSSPNEMDDWRRIDLPTDDQGLQNALILRSCGDDRTRAWPLLVDPHNQAELWIRALHEVDTADQSRPDTRQSDRSRSSTRQSGRSSGEPDVVPLDYTDLGQTTDDSEAEPQLSDNEVDQFLQSLNEPDEQDASFQESLTPVTSRSGRKTNSGMIVASDWMLTDKLAEVMGLQIEDSSQQVPSGPTPDINLSIGNILIVAADDPQLVDKLRAAVKRGLVTLVTHMERRRWGKALELLLTRQTFTNTEGVLQVPIGKTAVDYHPSFRLYLSSSLPLFMPGEGQYPLPFSKVCTITMSVSRQGICDMLLVETLRLERPEFDGQLRSVQRDVSLHKQQITYAKEFILEKVLNLNGPLLKDSAMLESVIQSKNMICMAEERCREAETMKKQLMAKQDDFLPVAQHGALLFVILSELHKLHPYYRYSLKSFLDLFHNTISERNRGKKSSGSPAARAAELITTLSRKMFDRTSWSLFQNDNHLFPFLLAVEKLMNNGSVSRDEWQLFNRMSSGSPVNQPQGSDVQKLYWVSQQVWDSIDELEVLTVFSGLKQSVVEHSEQWREYFNLPPVLLGVTPGDYAHLTIFQKALLWKTFKPDQLFHVCQNIVLYQMGASMTQALGYHLELVLPVTSRSRPVLFLLPSQKILKQGEANVLKDPVTDVINLARTHRKNKPFVKVTLGETRSMEKALTAVKRGMKTGCWVILENCHLASCWSEELMHELETIVNMPEILPEHDSERQFTGSNSEELSEITEAEDLVVHPDFRLWLITRPDVGLPLPAVLIQCGIKLACEAQENFRDSVRTNCHVVAGSLNNYVPVWGPAATNSVFKSDVHPCAMYTLAYLHSLLLQRRKYGQSAFSCPYQWLQADLLAGLDSLRHMSHACHASLPPAAVEVMLGYVTYGGHVTNGLDLNAVKSMAKLVTTEQVKMDSRNDTPTYEYMDTYMDTLPDVLSCQQLGLFDTSGAAYQSKLSSGIADRLALCTGIQRTPISISIANQVNLIADETLNKISVITESIRAHDLAQEAATSVTSFIQRELIYFQNLLEGAIKDLELLMSASSGLVAFTPGIFNLVLSLAHCLTPLEWRTKHGTDVGLASWLVNVGKQVNILGEYLHSSPLHPPSFCLGAFAHPQAFLACILMDHARSTMKSVYALEFSVEIMHPENIPTSPPSRGVYLSGLKLNSASWDADRGCITELHTSPDTCDLPIVWLKPIEVIRSRVPSAKVAKSDSDIPSFDCPFITGGDWGADASTLVTSLPLPSVVPEGILKQRRVSIRSSLC